MPKPTESIQKKALQLVNSTKNIYKAMGGKRRAELSEIYREVMSYVGEKQADWSSTLKVNFANQIESLVTARLTSRNPKFIVSLRQHADDLVERYFKISKPGEEPTEQELQQFAEQEKEVKKFRAEIEEWSEAVQDYLNFAFEEYGYNAKVRQGAKALVRYGNVYGTVNYRYETFRKRRDGKIEEVRANEYPEIDIISWSEMWLDPRFIQTADSPSVIRSHDKVRLGELMQSNDDLINLDKIKNLNAEQRNPEKQEMYQIMFTDENGADDSKKVKHLTIDKYYGYFNADPDEPEKEGLYEIWVVSNAIIVKLKEIPRIPIHSAGCFEDVEQHYSIGYVEPMLGLQREYNFKLNSAIEYVNTSLNRSYFWDPNSGVNPKSLMSQGPGSLIPATKGMESAQLGVQEIPHREINNSYFANNNEVRRDMQSVAFTVDTTAPSSTQGFTNTATAVRARFFESNVIYADTLKHYEEFLVRIAYDMLDAIAENAKEDIIIARLGEQRFKWAKPEVFEDAPLRYAIRVEVGSSSFDTVESRREEALAQWTVLKEAAAAGLDVSLEEGVRDIMRTFERPHVDRFFKKDMSGLLATLSGQPQQEGPNAPSKGELEGVGTAKPSLENPGELTQAIVQGTALS